MTKAEREAYRAAARRLHHRDGECEVDEGATVSASNPPDGGAYVKAWVWVPADEMKASRCTCCRHYTGTGHCRFGCQTCVACGGE